MFSNIGINQFYEKGRLWQLITTINPETIESVAQKISDAHDDYFGRTLLKTSLVLDNGFEKKIHFYDEVPMLAFRKKGLLYTLSSDSSETDKEFDFVGVDLNNRKMKAFCKYLSERFC